MGYTIIAQCETHLDSGTCMYTLCGHIFNLTTRQMRGIVGMYHAEQALCVGGCAVHTVAHERCCIIFEGHRSLQLSLCI